ncbi:MAG: FAD-binding protein [Gemmatimonadota bacterium]
MSTITPRSVGDVVDAMRGHARVVPHGRMTKAPLIAESRGRGDDDVALLDMTALSGVSEYQPGEYTFTALAGTPLREIAALLAAHHQYMPFDPPFGEEGATLAGTVAAGMNGPGRLRYGGLRDFVIGVRFVDGTGTLVGGGGKVVKNAAGFDLPKLMVGSMGRLGVITELSFKVFPAPHAWRTLRVACAGLGEAAALIARLGRIPMELEALELEPDGAMVIRVSGDEAAVDAHAQRVGAATGRPFDVVAGEEEAAHWSDARAFAWVGAGHWLVKIPVTPARIAGLDAALDSHGIARRYGVAGNVAWAAWPVGRPLAQLGASLAQCTPALSGLVVRGPALNGAGPWLGAATQMEGPFARHIKRALDPDRRLPALAG